MYQIECNLGYDWHAKLNRLDGLQYEMRTEKNNLRPEISLFVMCWSLHSNFNELTQYNSLF